MTLRTKLAAASLAVLTALGIGGGIAYAHANRGPFCFEYDASPTEDFRPLPRGEYPAWDTQIGPRAWLRCTDHAVKD